MAKSLEVSLNYIIHTDGAVVNQYPRKSSVYNENANEFRLTEKFRGGEIIITKTDIANWLTAAVAGIPYTLATMRTFLQTETEALV